MDWPRFTPLRLLINTAPAFWGNFGKMTKAIYDNNFKKKVCASFLYLSFDVVARFGWCEYKSGGWKCCNCGNNSSTSSKYSRCLDWSPSKRGPKCGSTLCGFPSTLQVNPNFILTTHQQKAQRILKIWDETGMIEVLVSLNFAGYIYICAITLIAKSWYSIYCFDKVADLTNSESEILGEFSWAELCTWLSSLSKKIRKIPQQRNRI